MTEDTLHDRFNELNGILDDERDSFQKNVQEVKDQLLASQESLNSLIATFKTDIETTASTTKEAIQSDLEEITSEIEHQVERLDLIVEQQQGNFANAEAQRSQQFNESQSHFLKDNQTAVITAAAAFKERLDELETQASSLTSSLKEKDEQAAMILGQAAASVVAGGYIQEAREQRKEADTWRLIAIGIAIAILALVAISQAFAPLEASASLEETLHDVLVRSPFGLVPTLVASFAIRESGKHRAREQTARRLALELTAFRPFLAELPVSDRNSVISKGASRYFGNIPQGSDEDHRPTA